MTRALYSLARRCAEHGRLVVVIWLLACLALLGAHRAFPGAMADSYQLPGTDSGVAQDLMRRAFPGTAAEGTPVVLHSPSADLASGAGAAQVAQVAAALKALDIVAAVRAPADDPALVSKDGRTAIVQVTVTDAKAASAESGDVLLSAARGAAGPDLEVEVGGWLGSQVSRPETKLSEALGLGAALLVLLLSLRKISATVIPIVNAMVAVAMGLAVVGLIGNVVFIPDVAPTLGTMLGLGVGIDYALFLIVRHRTLLQQRFEVADSIGRTAGTAGAGIVFAGCTLIAAVCGLALTGLSFLAWLGFAAGIVVAIAVLASFTFVPAMMGLAGRRVLPKHMTEPHDPEALDRSRWARLASWVTHRPWPVATGATLLLLLLAAPLLNLSLGHTDAGYLPQDTTGRRAYDLTAQSFGAGATAPLAVVSRLYAVAAAPNTSGPSTQPAPAGTPRDPRARDPRLQALRADLLRVPGVVAVGQPGVSTDGGVSIMSVTPAWSSADPRTEDLVHRLRDGALRDGPGTTAMESHLGGVTAAQTDLAELIAARTPWFILGVVTLSFLLLMLAYRSLLIPFKAAAMNLLSIAAAYGVVTAVFQWGWGARAIGLEGPVPIESYVPMMMFAVLFGLSMDYEVFLLTAFREHWERSGDMVVSVRRGLADTGRVVTAAALIMVVVFASFILSTNPVVKMFGVGLATAVAVDATIVRCLLVPAIMVLAAKATWWLPRWLDVLLPQLHVEGDPVALDAVADESLRASAAPRGRRVTSPAAVVGALSGVALAWVLCSRLPGVPPEAGVAVAVSAVLGGVLALLPARVEARAVGAVRAVGVALGALLAVLVVSVVGALTPPADHGRGPLVAGAILAAALAVVLVVGRALAIPTVLGAVAAAVAEALVPAAGAVPTTVLLVAVGPALLALLVASAVPALVEAPGDDVVGVLAPWDDGDRPVPLESLLAAPPRAQDVLPDPAAQGRP